MTTKFPGSPEALPLGELSPQVTERASTPTDKTAVFLYDSFREKAFGALRRAHLKSSAAKQKGLLHIV